MNNVHCWRSRTAARWLIIIRSHRRDSRRRPNFIAIHFLTTTQTAAAVFSRISNGRSASHSDWDGRTFFAENGSLPRRKMGKGQRIGWNGKKTWRIERKELLHQLIFGFFPYFFYTATCKETFLLEKILGFWRKLWGSKKWLLSIFLWKKKLLLNTKFFLTIFQTKKKFVRDPLTDGR